jgi:hypothetical protein
MSDSPIEVYNPNRIAEELQQRMNVLETRLRMLQEVVDNQATAMRLVMAEALRRIAKDLDVPGNNQPISNTPMVKEAWSAWINKLGGKPAQFIEALLIHKSMTRVQLKIVTRSGSSTVDVVLKKLRDLSLIEKDGGGQWRLRDL